jgi:hypothetical protein
MQKIIKINKQNQEEIEYLNKENFNLRKSLVD